MIKIQKKDFNIEKEINFINSKNSNIGAVNLFIGFVKDYNNNKDVKFIELEVYKEMAINELSKIRDNAIKNWGLIDCLIIHRYGKLSVNEKIVMVVCFSQHRKESFEASKFIMDYLKKDAPLWKKEFYNGEYSWLKNSI
ncbi:molybdenum cofactor biosynthesis protein MoaE [Pelagibacteraceae bacterium]|nr:molybdenum cofactor biosynthesis protein MoaE [Pelagibacteraceae bacterium]